MSIKQRDACEVKRTSLPRFLFYSQSQHQKAALWFLRYKHIFSGDIITWNYVAISSICSKPAAAGIYLCYLQSTS